ncbi:MAG: tRNA epoxyqueuosine(34) reductase QueG [Gammaproteobacteria bacterium]|nr:tRNA epoxyqueuosine(34) reductase QueG [Gammaproteobacteria bacterium]
MTGSRKRSASKFPEADESLADRIRAWGRALGFQQTGIARTNLDAAPSRLADWLRAGYHGEMGYMARNTDLRGAPAALHPGTVSVISLRMDYWPEAADWRTVLDRPGLAYVSRYALGRDYHKLLRRRLQTLAHRIEEAVGPFGYRVFVDSAPVLEKPLAQLAGLGWTGKHTNLINEGAGSWFFLGEIYTDLDLPPDPPAADHCGRCRRCIDVCPTQAIIAPYQLDARRCISYLTIELRTAIPEPLRPLIGNRIYGCDDCQLICPWNRFAKTASEPDFGPRLGLDRQSLDILFAWSESEFLKYTEGSAIRRIGHECWLRNIAVAMGNTLARRRPPYTAADEGDPEGHEVGGDAQETLRQALTARLDHPSAMVREHVQWALSQQEDGSHPPG